MILDRLEMKNFKRFRDEKICFKDGIKSVTSTFHVHR